MLSLAYRYDLRPVFDDFLIMTLCSFSRNIATGLSYDEEIYMETISKYSKEFVRDIFPPTWLWQGCQHQTRGMLSIW